MTFTGWSVIWLNPGRGCDDSPGPAQLPAFSARALKSADDDAMDRAPFPFPDPNRTGDGSRTGQR